MKPICNILFSDEVPAFVILTVKLPDEIPDTEITGIPVPEYPTEQAITTLVS